MNNYKLIDEKSTYIEEGSIIEEGVTIHPNVTIRGKSIIRKNAVIDSNTIITDSEIGEDSYIISSVITDSKIGNNNKIGPFAHIRVNTIIGDSNKIGGFVEIKNSNIGDNNSASHLAYIGDVDMKSNVDIGAGVVFANYHSKKGIKTRSTVLDKAIVGSNSTVVSPVTIKENTMVAAATVVLKDIEEDSLYINRGSEVYKIGYYKGDK